MRPDKPIKPSSNGKYNLNFIDWQNEHEAIFSSGYDGSGPPTSSPIYGMDSSTFHSLMLEESVQIRLEQETLEKQLNGMSEDLISKVMKMRVGKTDKDCSICLKGFIKAQIIRVLKCGHIFHDPCIVPWLQKKACCPNCRADLE